MSILRIKIIIILLTSIATFNASSSSLSFMLKNDLETESYIKLRNQADPIYLDLYCNNFINDITVTINGTSQSKFLSKNTYESTLEFENNKFKYDWIVSYNEKGTMFLNLKDSGLDFLRQFYKSGYVKIDINELNEPKIFTIKNKRILREKISLITSNCGIYL